MAGQRPPGGGPRVSATVAVVLSVTTMVCVGAVASILSSGDRTMLEVRQVPAVEPDPLASLPTDAGAAATTLASPSTIAPATASPTMVTPADASTASDAVSTTGTAGSTTGTAGSTTGTAGSTTDGEADTGSTTDTGAEPAGGVDREQFSRTAGWIGMATPPGQAGPREFTASEIGVTFGDSIVRVEATGCGTVTSGTAWAISETHLVTNGHVVHTDMTPLLVDRDGSRFRGAVVAWLDDPDIAVIRTNRPLDPLSGWAQTSAMVEGDPLVIVGYPQPGLDFSVVRAGVVSFRAAGSDRPAIRSAGAIDLGGSGSPVFTVTGSIAGVLTEAEVASNGQSRPASVIYTRDALADVVDAIVEASQAADSIEVPVVVATQPEARSTADCEAFVEDAPAANGTAEPPRLELGTCYDHPRQDPPGEATLRPTDCDLPHDGEIFHLDRHPEPAGAAFPGEAKLVAAGELLCRGAFDAFVGLDYAFSRLEIEPFVPTEATWAADDRLITCGLHHVDLEPLEGSMAGSGR